LQFDLATEAEALRHDLGRLTAGRAAKTLVKAGTLRATLICLRRGVRVEPEATAGESTVLVVEGRVRVQAGARVIDLSAGQLVALSQNLRDPIEAAEDSTLLITVAWEEGAGAWDEEERQGHL
jgi:quercetin dioxygenase-like cupin family protein